MNKLNILPVYAACAMLSCSSENRTVSSCKPQIGNSPGEPSDIADLGLLLLGAGG